MSPPRYRYQTIEFGETDIHVKTLRDKQQFSDDGNVAARVGISSANWSLFGVIWPSGDALANVMFACDVRGKRILEVGCGIGLASLVLNHRRADITATDHHPEVQPLLAINTALNGDTEIPFVRTAWADPKTELGEFDLIIGSDVLYETEHAVELAGFIDNHARPHCEVIIADPGRRQRGRFNSQMAQRGYTHLQEKAAEDAELVPSFSGWIMHFKR